MADLPPGLYETLVTDELAARLASTAGVLSERVPLHPRDAADRLAWHVSQQVERALLDLPDEQRVDVGVQVVRALIDHLATMETLGSPDPGGRPVQPGAVLRAVLQRRPDGSAAPLGGPLIPVLDTTLLTNAPGEPTLWSQLISEIESADEIDVVMAFIRRSGIRPLLEPADEAADAGAERLCWFITGDGTSGFTVSSYSDPDAASARGLEMALALGEFLELEVRPVLDLDTAMPAILAAMERIKA